MGIENLFHEADAKNRIPTVHKDFVGTAFLLSVI